MRKGKIIGVIVSIWIIIVIISIAINGPSILTQFNLSNPKQMFEQKFTNELDYCTNTTGLALSKCKQSIGIFQSQCSFYTNPSVCNDQRINQIITTRLAYTFPILTNFTTYRNEKFGFTIDYPNSWSVLEYSSTWNETLIVNFTDNNLMPNALFLIKERHNDGNSFENVVNTYLHETGTSGYPISLQSKSQIMIGNKTADRIQYTQSIGDATCKYEDFFINGGEFVPVISFSSCDENNFKEFLPTYEKMASTFKLLWQ